MPKTIGNLKLYSLEDIRDELGITPFTMQKILRAGKCKGRKLGSKWWVTEQALQEFFETGNQDKTNGQPKAANS